MKLLVIPFVSFWLATAANADHSLTDPYYPLYMGAMTTGGFTVAAGASGWLANELISERGYLQIAQGGWRSDEELRRLVSGRIMKVQSPQDLRTAEDIARFRQTELSAWLKNEDRYQTGKYHTRLAASAAATAVGAVLTIGGLGAMIIPDLIGDETPSEPQTESVNIDALEAVE